MFWDDKDIFLFEQLQRASKINSGVYKQRFQENGKGHPKRRSVSADIWVVTIAILIVFGSARKGNLDLIFASARCLEYVCGTIAMLTSARIVERVIVGSTSACRTILRSSLLVVFLVAPDTVFHCSQQFLKAYSERYT
ncbi:uncharacterized protein TNCV_1579531 [Trichonephila clavipes]|nr:uncharacterized protein TNCV_1579531 [Trichonephila clavipes]